MIGEAEKDIARPAAIEFGLELAAGGLDERGEAAARFGRRGEPRRLDKASASAAVIQDEVGGRGRRAAARRPRAR